MKNSLSKNAILQHNGITICYETFGDKSNPCIILIMGIEGQLINWPFEMTQALASQGFYLITFDNRDAGLSMYYDQLETPGLTDAIAAKQKGKDIHPPYTLEDMAFDIITLMDGLHIEKAHIVGISMGGMIGQVLAIEHPERVLSLAIIASTSGEPNLPPAKPEVLDFFFAPKKQDMDLASYLDKKMQLYKIYNHPSHVDEKLARDFFAKAFHRAYHPAGFARQLLAMIFAEPRTQKLKQLEIPCVIIHGDYDPVFSLEHAEHLAQSLPKSRLSIIKNLGHGLPACLCEQISALIIKNIRRVNNNV